MQDASPQEILTIAPKYKQANAALEEARKAVEALPKPVEYQIAKLHQKLGVAKDKGDVEKAAALSQQIVDLQAQAAPTGQQQMEMQPFKSTVETAEQMQARKRQNAQQAAGAESTDYVNQRIQERRAQRKLTEKNAPPREQPQRDEELRHLAEKETVDKIVATFPAGETITPGQVMHGMGGEQAHLRDLQTQLAIAKTTRNSQAISDINEQIADIKAKQEERATSGTPIERLPQLGEGRLPEARAKEAEAEQHADKQSEMLQGFVAQLQKIKLRPDTAAVSERVAKINKAREAAGKPPITLADQSATMLDTARMAYLKSHLDEIEARRAAFGLPPMADWEIGEARARVMEGFNELQRRWGQAVDKNAPAGQRQFGAPVAAVATLQDQMRTNIYNNVASAADRLGKETKGELKEKTTTRSATPTLERDENGQLVQTGYAQPTGPQPVTERLNLQGQPKLAKDAKQNTLDMIDQVLNNLETRTTAVPTQAKKAPEKVTSLADIAKLMEEETSGERTAKTDAASVELLHQLRDTLPKTSNEEFVLLAQEQVQRIMEGNLPNPYAVRELGEMIAAQKEGRRSESAPGSDLYESAQPQKSLFPETEVLQTVRATPENFQKLLDSNSVQELRAEIADQKASNQAALQTLQDSITPAKTAAQQAEAALNKAKEKAAPLLASAAKERGEPTWYAPAVRKVMELETALQSIPSRLKLLKDIREKITGLNEDQKQTLLKQVNTELQKADKSNNANAVKELFEFKQALLSKEPLTKEINRLTAAVRLAKRTIDTARADLNSLVKQHVGDKTIRESLLAQADKATEKIDKLTKAFEETQRQEAREQAKPAEEKPATEATPMRVWREALQRGREGLDLPGMRNLVDTTNLKAQVLAIRQALGSFDAQLSEIQDPKRKPKEGDKTKIAELQQKRADASTALDTIYKNAPRITSEIKEQGQLDLEKAFDEAQAGAYDLKVRKKQAKAGELPPTLRAAKKGPTVVNVRTNQKSESGARKTATPREELAAAALEQVAKGRAELKELQDRMQYLRDNNKAKKSGRYTDTFKALQAKEESLKSNIKQAENASAVFAREAAETKAALASSRKSVESAQSGKEALALKEAEEARQEEASSGPAVFRTITRKGASLKEQTIKRVADAITKEWSVVPNIIVIADESELPDNIRKQAERDEMIGKIPGVYDTETKKVYLVASNLFDENDIALTIAHEIAGHFGLREVLGGTYAKIMNYVYNGNASVRTAADAKMAANSKLSREVAVEEVLAEAAEQGPQADKGVMAALRRVWYAIKQALARVKVFNVSDAEINQIVVNARRYVQEGVGKKKGEAPVNEANYRTKANYTSDDDLSKFAKDTVAAKQGFFEKLGGNKMLQFEMLTTDMRAGLRKAMEAGAKQMGDTRLFQQAMMSVTAADQKMPLTLTALGGGALEVYTDEKGFKGVRTTNETSAKDIFASTSDVPDRYGNGPAKMGIATAYMIAQRAANKGLTKLDLGALGVTEEKLAAVMRQVDADPELKKALERTRSLYNKFNAGMIRFLASTGAITQKEADGFLKEGDYVPYYRVNANGVAQLVLGAEKTITIGDIRHQPYLAELKGGETKILPLDESLPRNTMLLVDKAMTNMATRNVGYALYSVGKGNGEVNERTGKAGDLMPIHKGDGPADPGVIRWNQEPDRNDPKDTGKRWLRVQTNDTVLGGIPAEIIVKSLEGAHLTLPGFLKLGAIAGDFLRAGVTRTPVYPLRQLFRDPFAAAATAGLDYGPIKAIYKAGSEYLKMNTGQSETAAKLIEKGLIQSGIFTGDPDDISKFALQLASGKDMGIMDKFFAMADSQAMKADAATRVLVYENAIKNGLSEVEADHAVRESMNFHKRGLSPTVQYASRMIPFFNAQIQGLNVLFKAATGNMPFNEQLRIKQKFQNNAMMLMGMGLVYAMMMEDDEYFKNAKPKDKYSNFFIPLPGVDEPLKLPIPYEFGWFFSAAVATVDAMKAETDGPQQLRALREMFIGAIPGSSNAFVVPQIVKPIAEVWTNKSFFSGQPLESQRLQKLNPEARYYDTTTEIAKSISKMVPILSPIQIEHIVTGYLGSLPLMAAAATDGLFKGEEAAETPTRRLSQMPMIGSSFQRKYGGEDADVVYKLATEALQAKATFNEYKNTGKLNEAKEYFQEHRAELAVAPMALQYEKFMGNLRKQEQIIRQSSMPADKKQERIDLLDKQRQLQSERYAQAIKRAEAAVGRTTPQ